MEHDRALDPTKDRALDYHQVCEITGLSHAHIDRMEREGKFPSRVLMGDRAVRWWRSEIATWLASRPRGPVKPKHSPLDDYRAKVREAKAAKADGQAKGGGQSPKRRRARAAG